jgi:hypothetical protein
MPYPALAAAITQIGRAVQCHADDATDGRLLTPVGGANVRTCST